MTDRSDAHARRAAGLDLALAALRGRRRRRHAGRAAVVTATLAVAVALALPWRGGPAPAVTPPSGPGWTVVRDDPGIVARLAPRGSDVERWIVRTTAATSVEILGDRELGDWLRRAGRAPGRMRVGDRVVVPDVAAE